MKLFRRISALALVLVLVCLFSVSAFASNGYDLTQIEDFGNGQVAHAAVKVDPLYTEGMVFLQTEDIVENYIEIGVRYKVKLRDKSTADVLTATESIDNSYDYMLCRTFNANSTEKLYYAKYTFSARFGVYLGGPYDFYWEADTIYNP